MMARVATVALMLVAACGGSPEGQASTADTPTVPCAKFACMMNPDGTRFAAVTVSPDQTNSLTNNCAGAATCGDVTTGKPVCVQYATSGGILLDLFACPTTCCQ